MIANPLTSASPVNESSQADGSPFDRLDRIIVLVATLGASVFFVLTISFGLATGEGELVRRAIIPGAVLVVGLPMLLLGRPRALIHLATTAVAIALYVGFFEPFPNAELGLVSMGLGGVLLVRRRHTIYVAGVGFGLLAVGLWWGEDAAQAVNTALVFVFSGWLFAWLKTQLEQRQHAFKRLFERYRDMFTNAPIPMWELDLREMKAWLRFERQSGRAEQLEQAVSRARVVAVNREAVRLLGPAAETDPSASPLTVSVASELLTACRKGVDPSEVQVDIDALLGAGRHLLVTLACQGDVDDFGPDGVLLSARDVTEVVESARSLELLVESKDRFIATVSHELRTPITAVVGLAQELRSRFDDFEREEIDEFIGLLSDQGTDVANIVEDLLVAARAEVGTLALHFDEFDLLELISTMRLGSAEVSSSGEVPMVRADPGRLRQIVRNLLTNAERYGGDLISIRLGVVGADALVEVRDDGVPIAAADRQRIFEAYQSGGSASGRPGSVGLGLTVSRQLARLMGGDLTYGHDGADSVFSLRLPLKPS